MEIKIQIDKCSGCKHLSHTGQYTKGGAKPCCDHAVTCKEKGYDCFKRIIPYTSSPSPYSIKDFHEVKAIPIWCRLKRGCKY